MSRRERDQALIARKRAEDKFLADADTSTLCDALELAYHREDCIRRHLAKMGDQNSGVILQNIERILNDDAMLFAERMGYAGYEDKP